MLCGPTSVPRTVTSHTAVWWRNEGINSRKTFRSEVTGIKQVLAFN